MSSVSRGEKIRLRFHVIVESNTKEFMVQVRVLGFVVPCFVVGIILGRQLEVSLSIGQVGPPSDASLFTLRNLLRVAVVSGQKFSEEVTALGVISG